MITGNEFAAPTTSHLELMRYSDWADPIPVPIQSGSETLLQKWSAMAMQSLINDENVPGSRTVLRMLKLPETTSYDWEIHYPMYVAAMAKRYAQALINELNKDV